MFKKILRKVPYLAPLPIYGGVSFYEYDRAINDLNKREASENLRSWKEVEPTLQTGDLLLLHGTGNVSKQICLTSFLWWGWRRQALEYSHVGVIVKKGQKAYLLEAIDNNDVCMVDIDGVVRLKQVQLGDPQQRIFGIRKDGSSQRCYDRCAVRRLQPQCRIPDNIAENFTKNNVGRSLDTAKTMVLAFVHPKLYHRDTDRITCAELVVNLWKESGIVKTNKSSIAFSPLNLGFDSSARLGFVQDVTLSSIEKINVR
eukprot:PhF_6_TR17283/c0_g1_i1/m.26504